MSHSHKLNFYFKIVVLLSSFHFVSNLRSEIISTEISIEELVENSINSNKTIRESGIWGDIEERSTYLDAPDKLLDLLPEFNQDPVWRFKNVDIKKTSEKLQAYGLDLNLIEEIKSNNGFNLISKGVDVVVPVPTLLKIDSKTREKIYSELAKDPDNKYYSDPTYIFGDFNQWLDGLHLNTQQIVAIRKLIWFNDKSIVFSDYPALVKLATNALEIKAVKRLYTRTKTLRLFIYELNERSEDEFLNYWTVQGKWNGGTSLLKGFLREENDSRLAVATILPPLARSNLYTFPDLEDGIGGRFPDCNWTTLNFFVSEPKPFYLDSNIGFIELSQNYHRIDKPTQLGDVICFLDKDNNVKHTATYIAGSVYFTKNGVRPFSPWILMSYDDLRKYYDRYSKYIVFLRKNNI
jgi:hypothetical protein